MLSIACSYAEAVGADTVYHGSALVDSQAGYWDGSIEFLENINNLTALNRKNRIQIKAPLIKASKKEIIRICRNRYVQCSSRTRSSNVIICNIS